MIAALRIRTLVFAACKIRAGALDSSAGRGQARVTLTSRVSPVQAV